METSDPDPRAAPAARPHDLPHALPHGSGYHVPVLCMDVVTGLVTDRSGLYVDATLGGGGHSDGAPRARSRRTAACVGIDRDADALAEATARLDGRCGERRFSHASAASFGDLASVLGGAGIDAIDGLLLDLGVSSHQFDARRARLLAPLRRPARHADGPARRTQRRRRS